MEPILGVAVGLAIGLTGVGGGVLTVPLLVLAFGVGSSTAVGTALLFSAIVKLPAIWVYLREQSIDLRVYRLMLLGGIPGVVAGSLVIGKLQAAGLERPILGVIGLTIAAMAVLGLSREIWKPKPTEKTKKGLIGLFCLPIGFEVGFSSAGAGALGTLVLIYLSPLAPAAIVGTDLLFGLTLSAVGGALHLGLGSIDPGLLLKLVAGGLPGSLVGARLATIVPARPLKIGLLVWLVGLGLLLVAKSV